MANSGNTTYTLDTLYCNAGHQECTVRTGLTYLNEDLQYLHFKHGDVIMMGWLKSYNSTTGLLKFIIDRYNAGGGDSYTNWWVTTIYEPVRNTVINWNRLRELASMTGSTASATEDQVADLAVIVAKMWYNINYTDLSS